MSTRYVTDFTRSPEAEGNLRLRVLSYNIHHGEGVDRKLDLPRIASVIESVKPDLVALQEVDQGTERSNEVDQAAELARLTGLDVVFGGNIRYQGGDYGNAVLSRLPIGRHKNHLLPDFDDGEQRGVLQVEVELPDGYGKRLDLTDQIVFRLLLLARPIGCGGRPTTGGQNEPEALPKRPGLEANGQRTGRKSPYSAQESTPNPETTKQEPADRGGRQELFWGPSCRLARQGE